MRLLAEKLFDIVLLIAGVLVICSIFDDDRYLIFSFILAAFWGVLVGLYGWKIFRRIRRVIC